MLEDRAIATSRVTPWQQTTALLMQKRRVGNDKVWGRSATGRHLVDPTRRASRPHTTRALYF